jgi:hypothetical protein
VKGTRRAETWRLEDRAGTGVRVCEVGARIAVLPGFSIRQPAIEIRRLVCERSQRPISDTLEAMHRELDGYEWATHLDMALWRANT